MSPRPTLAPRILAPLRPVTDGMNLLKGFLLRAQELVRVPAPAPDPDQGILTEWRGVLAALPGAGRVFLGKRFLQSDRDVPSFSLALYADFQAPESEHSPELSLSLCLGRTSRPSLVGVLRGLEPEVKDPEPETKGLEVQAVWVVFLKSYGVEEDDLRELLLIFPDATSAFRQALSEVRSWRADPARSLFEDRALTPPPPDL